MKLLVRPFAGEPPASQPLEIVERKGRGHPDTLCDAIAEEVSIRLSRYYIEHFGAILHHNVDKVLLSGGSSRARFGEGEVLKPIEICLGGRATARWHGEEIPVHDIACAAAGDVLRSRVRGLDVESDVRVMSHIRPGSSELAALFAKHNGAPLANDTSFGVGFAPPSELERAVLAAEGALTNADTTTAHPEIGEDVKVMGVRERDRIDLTIACAFIAEQVQNAEDYRTKKQHALETALDAARGVTRLGVAGVLNASDDIPNGRVFLTVTGTSAEAGDDGQVGRGNRVGGLITPFRAMTLEAAAGKNPVSHCGKLYSFVAARMAERIVGVIPGSTDATCILLSEIGRPIDDPQIADVCVASNERLTPEARTCVSDIVRAELRSLPELCDALVAGQCRVF